MYVRFVGKYSTEHTIVYTGDETHKCGRFGKSFTLKSNLTDLMHMLHLSVD